MPPRGEYCHIVLAEDEPALRVLLKRQLMRAGYTVAATANGLEALDAIRQTSPDIVIADWMMPEMDGLELCRAVRELSKNDVLGFVFLVLLTANADKEHVLAGFEAGADDYLTKPYNADELLARLRAGQRILELQEKVKDRQLEVHRSNAQLAILNSKLQEQAITDELTRLWNRRHVYARLDECASLAARHKKPLSCIMIDVDEFKGFNDTHGHHAGDEVLREVAGTLKATLRRTDLCGRIGGEEFLVICPETGLHDALTNAERLRAAVEANSILIGGQPIGVTISLGAAELSPRHARPQDLVADADAAMYASKSNGRNRVTRFDAISALSAAADSISTTDSVSAAAG